MIRYKKTFSKIVIYLLLIMFTFIAIFPLLWGIVSSVRTDRELFRYAIPFSYRTFIPQEPTLDAYIALFAEFNFMQPIINTLIVAAACIILGCLINSVAAFSFATFDFKGKNLLFAIVLASFLIPFEAIALPLFRVVDGLGWVNTRHGIIIPSLANGLVLFLFTQFFKDIPTSFFEAARVDGASWRKIFMIIVIPLSVPVIITSALMIFMSQWNAFLWPLLVARSRDIQMIQTAMGMFQTERGTMWSLLYAGSMVSALIPLLLFLPFQKYFVQGITSSGVKG